MAHRPALGVARAASASLAVWGSGIPLGAVGVGAAVPAVTTLSPIGRALAIVLPRPSISPWATGTLIGLPG